MSQPVPLRPEQQRQLVSQIGQAVTASVPPRSRQVQVHYRAAGRHIEVDLVVHGPDGATRAERPSEEVVRLLGALRSGMYQAERGTWLAAELTFRPDGPPAVEFVIDEEPRWRRVPPRVGYRDELAMFPRADEFVPAWLWQRTGADPVPTPTAARPSIRTPRIHDGFNREGHPVVRRLPLAAEERQRVLDYLDGAPVVLAGRGLAEDAFNPDRPAAVPMTIRTDGSWVWPGAVSYYLREHAVSPDPDLLEHIRSRQFVVREVDEPARQLAIAAVTSEPSLD
ncbi:MAG: ferredoxin [Actinophytocola sp.]|uniref:ferredoxin n=1 Tax=Actinophytocola sp. TaxID=1872138 RepID=UPI00132B773D|nr:ferredoxin [Actinophytocola sp.]MPZ81691.1 ferredoxin [Actinophytocola sp.]